jgi:hypothetical protein
MGRLGLAFKLFFRVLWDRALAERVRPLLQETTLAAAPPPTTAPPATAAPPRPTRSEALTLLSVLQREARLVDFLKEDISAYADAQIGAAVRDVHRDAGAALERLFALRPVLDQPEGSDISIPANADGSRLRLVGNLGGTTPPRGKLQHAGWHATKLDVPRYTGAAEAARIVAPAEVEI